MTKIKQKVLKEKKDEFAIPISRKDIELAHPEIEERLTKVIERTDCCVEYDLCGLFTLIDFALKEQKIGYDKAIAEKDKEIEKIQAGWREYSRNTTISIEFLKEQLAECQKQKLKDLFEPEELKVLYSLNYKATMGMLGVSKDEMKVAKVTLKKLSEVQG